jgi:small subunit ribosomal protein S16
MREKESTPDIMLAIRMQRTGRKGHAMFRVVVQDSRKTPTSGKLVAQLGSYDPHAKTLILDKEKASFYLEHGAQPSPRTARLMQTEGIELPSWVVLAGAKTSKLRNPEKLRHNRPEEPKEEKQPVVEAPAKEVSVEPSEAVTETTASTEPVIEPSEDAK